MLATRSATASAPLHWRSPHSPANLTPADLIVLNFQPIPLFKGTKIPRPKAWQSRIFRPDDWQPSEGIGLRLGYQEQTGLYLYCLDLDSHTEHQNAERFLRRIFRRLPAALRAHLFTAISTGGAGRYIMFLCRVALPNGNLHDRDGIRAGEFLGAGRHVVLPTPDRWLHGKLTALSILDDQDLDLLLGACGYRPSHTSKSGETQPIEINDRQIAYWTRHIDDLIGKDGYPKWLKPRSQTYRTITGSYRSGDPSQDRYNVVRGLMMHGYDDPQIVALTLHFCAWNRTGRALYTDILRCIAKEKERQPNRRIYTGAASGRQTPAQPIERSTPRPAGRPTAYTPKTYLDALCGLLDAGDHVFKTRKERAQALGCSVSTVDRVERKLIAEGKIERGNSKDRSRSWVRVLGAIKTPAQSEPKPANLVLSGDPEQTQVYSTPMPQTEHGNPAAIEGTRLVGNPPATPAQPGEHNPACLIPSESASGSGGAVAVGVNLFDQLRAAIEAAPIEHDRPSAKRVHKILATDIAQFVKWSDRAYQRVLGQQQEHIGAAQAFVLGRQIATIEQELERRRQCGASRPTLNQARSPTLNLGDRCGRGGVVLLIRSMQRR